MDSQLTLGLTFLAWTSGIFLVVIGLFVVKLIIDLSVLTSNINKSAKIINNEIEPIMKNINESTTAINDIVKSATEKVDKINKTYDKISDALAGTASKLSTISGVFAKTTFKAVYSVFKRIFKLD